MRRANTRSQRHASRWPWFIGLIFALAAFTPGCQLFQGEEEDEPVAAGTTEPAEEGQEEAGPVEAVELQNALLNPGENVGQTVAGEATVDEVVSDRGFWLTSAEGDRLFAVVREDVPQTEMIDINKGQRLQIRGKMLASDAMEDEVEGKLEEQTKNIIRDQDYFVSMHHRDVTILQKPQAKADQEGQQQQEGAMTGDDKPLKMAGKEYGTFGEWDTDGDDRLMKEEVVTGVQEKQLYVDWDANDNQRLEQDEFVSHAYDVADVNQNDQLEQNEVEAFTSTWGIEDEVAEFETWDEDGDGFLDEDEFETEVEEAGLFVDWDADNNDYIDETEYGEGVFDVWDENDDDFVDSDEFGFDTEMEVAQRR